MTGSLFSIITPVGNATRDATASIKSISRQTYVNVEHLVVGDPERSSAEIVGWVRDQGVRWISSRGPHSGINAGLEAARGEVISCLAPGDVYAPWALATAARELAAHPDLDGVFGDGLGVDPSSGRQLLTFAVWRDGRSSARVSGLVQPATFFRRTVVEDRGLLSDRQAYLADIEDWLSTGMPARLGRIDEVLAIERLDPAAQSLALARRTLREDDQAARERELGKHAPRAPRVFAARAMAAARRRQLWLRFIAAHRRRPPARDGSWVGLITVGKPRLDAERIAAMLVPRLGSRFSWDAVRVEDPWFGSERS